MNNISFQVSINKSKWRETFFKLFILLGIIIPAIGLSQGKSDTELIQFLGKNDSIEVNANYLLDSYSSSLKSANTVSLKLDSIDEYKNMVIKWSSAKWYFYYNDNHELSSSEMYSYNQNGDSDHTVEHQTYNEDGLITTMLKEKTLTGDNDFDTTITLYSEINEYLEGRLINKYVYSLNDYSFDPSTGSFRIYPSDSMSYKYHYDYNENGQLEHSLEFEKYSSFSSIGYMVECYYYYTNEGILRYKYDASGNIYKYDYETKGNSLIKSEKMTYGEFENNPEVFDTITQWPVINCDEMTLDDNGNILSLRNSNSFTYDLTVYVYYNFMADFNRNANNQLIHSSYYLYADAEDSASYYETTRIDNTYDDEGNILVYHKTFYDARTEHWETYNKKTYYYSTAKSTGTGGVKEISMTKVYPNPVGNELYISVPPGFDGTCSVLNFSGKVLLSVQAVTAPVDVSRFSKGIYFLLLQSEGKTKALKFIKE